MEQIIARDLSKRYYHNELTYRDLENLEKQFGLKFDNLISEISFVEKNLNTKIDNLETLRLMLLKASSMLRLIL